MVHRMRGQIDAIITRKNSYDGQSASWRAHFKGKIHFGSSLDGFLTTSPAANVYRDANVPSRNNAQLLHAKKC